MLIAVAIPALNPKGGFIPRSLLHNKLMTNEVSLGLIPRSLLREVSFKARIIMTFTITVKQYKSVIDISWLDLYRILS